MQKAEAGWPIKTRLWKRVTAGVLVHETQADPLQIPFTQRRPDVLLGNGGSKGFWLTRGKTFTVPHVVRLDVIKHTGTTVTVRLRALR